MNEGGEVSDREKEIKTLVEGGSDVEFMMGIEPYIKKDFLAQYGSEIKEPMMDPKAKPKDMFSTVNVRLGNRRGIAGTYLLSDSGLIKEGDKAIKDLQEVGLENLNEEQKRDLQLFIQKHNKRKKQTPSEKAEEAFGLKTILTLPYLFFVVLFQSSKSSLLRTILELSSGLGNA